MTTRAMIVKRAALAVEFEDGTTMTTILAGYVSLECELRTELRGNDLYDPHWTSRMEVGPTTGIIRIEGPVESEEITTPEPKLAAGRKQLPAKP